MNPAHREAIELVIDFLKTQLEEDTSHDLLNLVRAVAHVTDISEAAMYGKSRRAAVCQARQLAMYMCKTLYFVSNAEIDRLFMRTHSTACRAIKRVEHLLTYDQKTKNQVYQITHYARCNGPHTNPNT